VRDALAAKADLRWSGWVPAFDLDLLVALDRRTTMRVPSAAWTMDTDAS